MAKERELSPQEIAALGLDEAPAVVETPRPGSRKEKPQVGGLETLINRAVDVVPLLRPTSNLLTTQLVRGRDALMGLDQPGVRLTPQAKAELEAAGISTENKSPSFIESYRKVRDTTKERTEAGSEQNPWWGRAGTGLGIGTTLLMAGGLPAVNVGTGALGRVGSAALTGTGYGGLFGATHGPADLTKGEIGQFANDVIGIDGLRRTYQSAKEGRPGATLLNLMGSGGVGGGVTGGILAGGAEALRPLAEPLRRFAVDKGRKAIQGGSDIASPTRQPLSDEAVQQVLDEGLMPAGANTPKIYRRIEAAASKRGDEYGKILDELEARGVKGPQAKDIADKLLVKWDEARRVSSSNKAVENTFIDEGANIEALAAEGGGQLGLRQAEDLKRTLQREARLERLKQSPTDEAMEDIASIVRQANEESVAAAGAASPGSRVSELADQFVPTKQKLGNLIEARTAAERGTVKSLGRQSVGLSDIGLGVAAGDPVSAYLTAMASSAIRSRLPSAVSAGAYGLSKALRAGASPAVGRYLAQAEVPLMSRAADDELLPLLADEDPETIKQRALAEALRRR